jgi:hypothetical protein
LFLLTFLLRLAANHNPFISTSCIAGAHRFLNTHTK